MNQRIFQGANVPLPSLPSSLAFFIDRRLRFRVTCKRANNSGVALVTSIDIAAAVGASLYDVHSDWEISLTDFDLEVSKKPCSQL